MICVLTLAAIVQQAASIRLASQPLMKQLLAGYDYTQRPHHRGQPERVRVGIYVEALLDVNQKQNSYTIQGYFRSLWKDPRLAFPGSVQEDRIYLSSPESGDLKIWNPNIYIQQGIKVSMADAGSESLLISRDGSVFWSRRMTAELRCEGFSFGQLPFDIQHCGITIADYMHMDTEVVVEWAEGSLLTPGPMEVEEWKASVASTGTFTQHFVTGNFSSATACLQFTRSSQQMATTMHVALLLVVASYTGFWIPAAAAPARTALAFLCFLMVLTNLQAVERKLPPLTLTHDVWLIDFLGGCMLFCFASLIEYGLVHVGLADIAKKKAAAEADKEDLQGPDVGSEQWFNLSSLAKLDAHCRWAFPVAFVIFMALSSAALPRYSHADKCIF